MQALRHALGVTLATAGVLAILVCGSLGITVMVYVGLATMGLGLWLCGVSEPWRGQ